MRSANLFGPLKGLCPYKALIGLTQASGLAGGFDLKLWLLRGGLFPLDKFSCIGNISPVSTSKTFANLLIFHLLFSTVYFLSIKIVSQKAEKCNCAFL